MTNKDDQTAFGNDVHDTGVSVSGAAPEREYGCVARPSLLKRLWRKAGFTYHLGDEPDGSNALEGWMRTDVRLHFGWADRLRLALTGKLFVAVIASMDTPSPDVVKTRLDWRIIEPRGDW